MSKLYQEADMHEAIGITGVEGCGTEEVHQALAFIGGAVTGLREGVARLDDEIEALKAEIELIRRGITGAGATA